MRAGMCPGYGRDFILSRWYLSGDLKKNKDASHMCIWKKSIPGSK